MSRPKKNPLSRLCVHTVTTKPWTLEQAIEKFMLSGIQGISVWRSYLKGADLKYWRKKIKKSGLEAVALVRGGFFTGLKKADRTMALEENRKAIDEASGIEASMVVLVCGATPGQSLSVSRDQIKTSLETLLPYAEKKGVKLAIEPLHPMYADSRSAINTLKQANELAEYFNSPWVGVALDVYHVWWDPDLEMEINRCAENKNLLAVHLCDWKVPTVDMLNDREIMGKGIIDISQIIHWIENTNYDGFYEVEIFSDFYWRKDQDIFLKEIIDAYLTYKI